MVSMTKTKTAKPKYFSQSSMNGVKVSDLTRFITAEEAGVIFNDLKINVHKGVFNEKLGKKLLSEIKAGLQTLQFHAIVFSVSGRLLDGQHKLWAVWKSGQEAEVLILSNAPEDWTNSFIKGAKRNFCEH